jgi:hypothetical protein
LKERLDIKTIKANPNGELNEYYDEIAELINQSLK